MSTFDRWEIKYDNLLPEDFEEDYDCHAGPEDGCDCPRCLGADEYITMDEVSNE